MNETRDETGNETPEGTPAGGGAQPPAAASPATPPLTKLLIELGPLLVFFFANAKFGIFVATGAFMVAIALSLGASWHLEKRLPPMALVTGVVVMVFGGLTLWLEDELFIKLKPTIVNTLFGVVLLGGLARGRSFLKVVFGPVFQLTDEGWRLLTVRWMFFFFALAILNEIVWRNFTTDQWVTFKVFGIMPLTLVFTMFQMPLLQKHGIEPDPKPGDSA